MGYTEFAHMPENYRRSNGLKSAVELLTRKGFTMKRLSVLILVAVLALVGWVLPAGAEKVRLTEDQMDTVSAAGFTLPSFTFPSTLPVDKSFGADFSFGDTFFGAGGGAMGFVKVPGETSLLSMGGGGGGGGFFGPWGAMGGGGGSITLFNATGPIVQFGK